MRLTEKGKAVFDGPIVPDTEYDFPGVEELEAQADEADCELICPTPTTLLVDLDSFDSEDQFDRNIQMVHDRFTIVQVEGWRSRSGNQHRRVTVDKPLHPVARVALEITLGSDAVRGMLSVSEFTQGREEMSYLFRPKGSPITIIEWQH